jgi:hypothetical protein
MATMYLPVVGMPVAGLWDNAIEDPATVRKSLDETVCILKTPRDEPEAFDPYLGEVTLPYGVTQVQTHAQIREIINVTHREDWQTDEF